MTNPTTTSSLVHLDPNGLLDHPGNVRNNLGDLDEGSGFHLMRAICTVVIWGGRPGGGRGLIGVGEVGATRARRVGSASC